MQCGQSRSTCTDCHGEKTAAPWHRDHAFADLCAACHQGQPEEAEAAKAHRGMVDPWQSCSACHQVDVSYAAKAVPEPPPIVETHGRVGPNVAAALVATALGSLLAVAWRRS